MEFTKERVEVSNSSEWISDYPAEVAVYNVYMMDERDLDRCFHEAEYNFKESDKTLNDGLEGFREDSMISWYGERIIPTINDYAEHPSMSLFIPNSLVYEDTMEKVKATRLTEFVGEELERCLEGT